MEGESDQTLAATATGRSVVAHDAATYGDSAPAPPVKPPTQGTVIGRYVVLSMLGAGGMGMVLAAYDPQLDRKVALKLIRAQGRSHSHKSRTHRLQREAQALAKLSHPNVVTVHDVGTHDGQVFMAMEFIEGQTLSQWMRVDGDRPRPWREVVRVFEAAGRGLVAAHEAGLVHRDFKPDNVMLGDDGQIHVMDFGLAQVPDAPESPSSGADEFVTEDADAFSARLTRTGALIGTPAYMAPEQFQGEPTTDRSDQFGFCVSLFEALYGTRPFSGETPPELAYSVTQGTVQGRPATSDVPAWLHKVAVRGLSTSPDERFASMKDLLTAMGTGEARRRRNRTLAVGGAVVTVAAALAGAHHYDVTRRTDACTAEGRAIDDVWNDEARRALRRGLVQTGVTDAATTADKVMPWLDDYARSWREHTTAACMQATVHETWDAPTLDKARWCLEERQLGISMLIDRLSRADAQSARSAVTAATALTPTQTCVDEASLVGLTEPPADDTRTTIEEVREQVVRAHHMLETGHFEEGLEVARRARTQAEALSWAPLTAASREIEAELLDTTGDYRGAEAAALDAYMIAVQSETWGVAVSAALRLAYAVGYRQARYDEGRAWAEHAAIAIVRAGDPLELRAAARFEVLGTILFSRGKFDEAIAQYERALAIRRQTLGPRHPLVSSSVNNIGLCHRQLGRFDEAKAELELAIAIREDAFGPNDLNVANSLNNLGIVYSAQNDLSLAKATLERAVAIREDALGPSHELADSLNNLGTVLHHMGDTPGATVLYERSLAVSEEVFGPNHAKSAQALDNLGLLHQWQHKYEEAKPMHERALAIRRDVLGPEHPDVANSMHNLGLALRELGNDDEARLQFESALPIHRQALGEEHPTVVQDLLELGKVLYALGDYAKAIERLEGVLVIQQKATPPGSQQMMTMLRLLGLAHAGLDQYGPAIEYFERAVEIEPAEEVRPRDFALSRFELARVLWDAPSAGGRDRERAIELASQARDRFEGEGEDDSVAEVETWLHKARAEEGTDPTGGPQVRGR